MNDIKSIEMLYFHLNKSIVNLLSLLRSSNYIRKHPDFGKILYAGFGEEKESQQKGISACGENPILLWLKILHKKQLLSEKHFPIRIIQTKCYHSFFLSFFFFSNQGLL